ncbi:hypothetical protein METBIDRAFT_32369 [Metschnikowia bicuspidata var. bicuspidata NRRL YB-4993]|uniref:Uncharacterized protein n=1 Tax=Metschnikowia bicuspidata var. bicuspidata NRRL YB-4993 TaxID=869754 RepID=A0A1A0H8N8_9ASCO|nr:hypothetical protein METBIDRAFT_32369 [Metschnikowia bicuspidata var. bicuspidata NRRL YB-4993]OBA20360.1 hypothetical protein METBIDRAFT_32369 [Metschnikowia bicuspidata var. bicuspidata NRRL YB-4993]
MPQLPKLRGKNPYRLSQQDSTSRVPSAHMDDFDSGAALQSYTPLRFSGDEVLDIPVYNREKNTIWRYSRSMAPGLHQPSSQPGPNLESPNYDGASYNQAAFKSKEDLERADHERAQYQRRDSKRAVYERAVYERAEFERPDYERADYERADPQRIYSQRTDRYKASHGNGFYDHNEKSSKTPNYEQATSQDHTVSNLDAQYGHDAYKGTGSENPQTHDYRNACFTNTGLGNAMFQNTGSRKTAPDSAPGNGHVEHALPRRHEQVRQPVMKIQTREAVFFKTLQPEAQAAQLKNTYLHNEKQAPVSLNIHKRDTLRDLENPEFLLQTTAPDRSKRLSVNTQFPRFVPQFQHQPQSRGPENRLQNTAQPIAETAFLQTQENLDKHTLASAGTSNHMSTSESHCSVQTDASSETDLLSLGICASESVSPYEGKADSNPLSQKTVGSSFEMAEAGSSYHEDLQNTRPLYGRPQTVPSYHEKEGSCPEHIQIEEPTSVYNSTVFDPHAEKELPPEPPKHQRRPLSAFVPHVKRTARPVSKVPRRSLDFCLDMGADYDKSRFMIPAEHQVHPEARRLREEAIFRKDISNLGKDARQPKKGGDRSGSSLRNVFSGFRRGLGRLFR